MGFNDSTHFLPFMNSVIGVWHLKCVRESQYQNWVKWVQHIRLHLSLQTCGPLFLVLFNLILTLQRCLWKGDMAQFQFSSRTVIHWSVYFEFLCLLFQSVLGYLLLQEVLQLITNFLGPIQASCRFSECEALCKLPFLRNFLPLRATLNPWQKLALYCLPSGFLHSGLRSNPLSVPDDDCIGSVTTTFSLWETSKVSTVPFDACPTDFEVLF